MTPLQIAKYNSLINSGKFRTAHSFLNAVCHDDITLWQTKTHIYNSKIAQLRSNLLDKDSLLISESEQETLIK